MLESASILGQFPCNIKMTQVDGVILVPNEETACENIYSLNTNWRLDLLDLIRGRVRDEIRSDNAVTAHLRILVRLPVIEVTAKIAAVGPIFLSLVVGG